MSSPQHRKLFPSFIKSRQSPLKNTIVKQLRESSNVGMSHFLENKILKGIKLNKLNQVDSIHESVYRQGSSEQQNSLRNIVNSSYFNSTQQSIVKIIGSNNNNSRLINQTKSNFGNSELITKRLKDIEVNKQSLFRNNEHNLEGQLTQRSNKQSFKIRQRLNSVRSQSSSNLSASRNSINIITGKKNIFQLTENKNQPQKRHIQSHNLQPSLIEFIKSQIAKKNQQQQLSKQSVSQQVQKLFSKNFNRNFIKCLIDYMNREWGKQQQSLLEDRKIHMLLNIMNSKFASFSQLINDFLSTQFTISYVEPVQTVENYSIRQTKLLTSILFKQCQQVFTEMKKLFQQLMSKLPQQGIIEQEFLLQELKKSILQIYDPKFAYSSSKMKQRFDLYYEVYCVKRNSLQTEIKHKLKPELTFIKSVEDYLASYQKQLTRLNTQINNLQDQKTHLMELLEQKTTFKPIQIDFNKLAALKNQAHQRIKEDFQNNIVNFHNKLHEKNNSTIQDLVNENKKLKKLLLQAQTLKQYHIDKLQQYLKSQPTKKDQSTQIFNIPTSNMTNQNSHLISQSRRSLFEPPIFANFLQNITTPFTFNQKITSSLISIITIDKILYDYEPIKSKMPLSHFRHYVYEWFIIRTGSKKIAQILLKNFLYSVKKYRNKHKRFNIFNKICGYSQFRGKNLQQDIEHLFYQSNLAWYYIVKLSLIYRRKLNENTAGYHIFPPIQCQQIFKLSLRKSYEMIEQFFLDEEIPLPENLNQRIDLYAINEISKFKQNDQEFQKQSLQQIHILRQLNFDIIVGFILDYVASQKAITLQALFRSIHLKNEEDKNPIGYGQFQMIYKKYFKQKRSKIQVIYSKFCMCNMLDVLNAQNMAQVIMFCIEDQVPLRSIFDKNETLKSLILSEKQSLAFNIKYDKKSLPNLNSFDYFKERFYLQFYDFFDMTIMLEEIFKITRSLIRKRLKKITNQQEYIQSLLQIPKGQIVGEIIPKISLQKEEEESGQDSQLSEQQVKSEKLSNDAQALQKLTGERSFIEQKLEQWKKIQQRIPHFGNKILTVEQLIIHNMRKKEMLQGCEFAWRTLRQILVFISK